MYPQVLDQAKPTTCDHAAATNIPVSHSNTTTPYFSVDSNSQPPPPPEPRIPVEWSTGLCDCFSDFKNYHAYPPHNKPAATGYPVSYGGNNTPPPYTSAPPPQFKAMTDWSTGLCDCFSDCNSCCMTCWCPCVTFGRVAEIVDKGSTSCGASGALYTLIACLTSCGCIYSCFYRTKMRRQFMLNESPCCDCLVHCFCEQCALCQEYRELKNRGFDMVAGWNGNVELNRGVSMAPTAPAYEHMTR